MDYKYIDQLLERYWQCETSLEEEQILRTFFRQKDVPVHLLQYQNLFAYQQVQQQIKLGEDFDARMLAKVERPVVKARRLTPKSRLIPLFKAAATVAIILTLGTIAQRSFHQENNLDYNYETYKDTYDDPQVAYEQITSALMMVSEGINKSEVRKQVEDSIYTANSTEVVEE